MGGHARVVDPADEHGRDHVDVGDPVTVDGIEHVLGPAGGRQADGRAGQQEPLHPRAGERQVVLDRQHVQQDVALAHIADRHGGTGVEGVIVMCAGDEFRDAGGPAGQLEHRRIVRVDLARDALKVGGGVPGGPPLVQLFQADVALGETDRQQ